MFIIQDDGAGVSLADLELFNARNDDFILQNEKGETAHGNGIRLIKKIAAAHNGEAAFSSAEPHGLSVRIQLPLIQ